MYTQRDNIKLLSWEQEPLTKEKELPLNNKPIT